MQISRDVSGAVKTGKLCNPAVRGSFLVDGNARIMMSAEVDAGNAFLNPAVVAEGDRQLTMRRRGGV